MELELRTLRDQACRAIDPPTARAIVGYRASSSILVIDDSDLSELIDPLENSIMISICLLVHSIFVLRIVEKLSEFFNENWPSSRARRKNNQIKLLLVHVQLDITRQNVANMCSKIINDHHMFASVLFLFLGSRNSFRLSGRSSHSLADFGFAKPCRF